MKVSTKQLLIVIGVVLLIVIAVGIWFYRKGKKQTTIAAPPADNAGGGATNNNPAGVSNSEISMLADALYQEMDGVSLWRNIDPYIDLMVLSDTDFVKVYNMFNTKHQAEGDGTLKEWIESESGIGEFATVQAAIVARMARLSLI